MRLLLTTYPKSGTHQVYPMFLDKIPDLIDHSNIQFKGADKFGVKSDKLPNPRYIETVQELRNFDGKRYGHVCYMPEYGEALRAKKTRVIFNVRDPRDIVIAEYMNMRKAWGSGAVGLWNMLLPDGKRITESADPIAILIELAAIRWEHWLGWLDLDIVKLCHFEDLRNNTLAVVRELRSWAEGVHMMMETEMVNQAKRTEGKPTFRKGIVGEHRNHFTAKHWQMSDNLLQPIMERLGYDRMGRVAET